MDNIEFEADKITATTQYTGTQKKSGMVKLLMGLGVKDEATANYILIGLSVILLALTVYLYVGILGTPKVDQAALDRESALMQLQEARQ